MQQFVSQLIFDRQRDRFLLDGVDVVPGDLLRVLIFDGLTGAERWQDTRMEMDGSGSYYLFGLLGYQIGGLFACRI